MFFDIFKCFCFIFTTVSLICIHLNGNKILLLSSTDDFLLKRRFINRLSRMDEFQYLKFENNGRNDIISVRADKM